MHGLDKAARAAGPLGATTTTNGERDVEADTARVLAGAWSWFTAFDDAAELGLIAGHVKRQHVNALGRWKVEMDRRNDNVGVAHRAAEVELRAAALEVLFELPGLLRRPELFDHPDFTWVIDGLFQVFQQGDREVLRRVAQRPRGRPDTTADARQTRHLVEHLLHQHDAFADHLRGIIASTDADDVSDAERATARRRLRKLEAAGKRTKKQAIEEVAMFQGISPAAVISRLRKASRQ